MEGVRESAFVKGRGELRGGGGTYVISGGIYV